MNKNKEFWNELNEYLAYPNESVVRFLASNRPRNNEKKIILDWGCANGRHLAVASRFGYDIIGADYNDKLLECAKELLPNGRFIYNNNELDIKEIKDNSIDTILCFGVIFWNSKDNQSIMLKNIYRMLKTEGSVAFVDFRSNRDTYSKIHYPNQIVLTQTIDEIKESINSAKLKILNTEICEFSSNNMQELSSWYQLTISKE